jgi:dTDP-4-amino-4,6-dideoxygalactose transaminase
MTDQIQIARPCFDDRELDALRSPLESGWLTQGPEVAAFEHEFAVRHNVAYAVAASSCTTALHLILSALDIGPGDEVIVPAFTWVATINAVLYCGASPVLVDVQHDTFNIDPARVAEAVGPRTRAVIPVHLFGLPAAMDELADAAPGVPLIEDAACAVGASYKGRSAGGLGIAGAFSFHPRKTITTGEGGMVTTDDASLADRVRCLRDHGAAVSEEQRHRGSRPYLLPDFPELGFNYRMTDLQGAVGRVQLTKLERFLRERRDLVERYRTEFDGVGWLELPNEPEDVVHGWQAFVCTVHESLAPMPRNELMDRLQAAGVSTRPGTHAVHTLSYHRSRFGWVPQDFSIADLCQRTSLALPLHNALEDRDVERIVNAIRDLG